jgi:hypothetical protein
LIRRVVVDLTPLLPDGTNGGVKQIRAFGTPEQVAQRYLAVFEEAVGAGGDHR